MLNNISSSDLNIPAKKMDKNCLVIRYKMPLLIQMKICTHFTAELCDYYDIIHAFISGASERTRGYCHNCWVAYFCFSSEVQYPLLEEKKRVTLLVLAAWKWERESEREEERERIECVMHSFTSFDVMRLSVETEIFAPISRESLALNFCLLTNEHIYVMMPFLLL